MKRKVPLLLILGIFLICASLCILAFFGIRAHLGAKNCQKILSQMELILPERTQGVPGTYPDSAMPALALDGVDYAAILEIPAYGITLPVADKWEPKKLYAAPSRFCGSAYDNTLVIGGADSSQQFSFCDKIDIGAMITVTDMTGVQFSYTVSRVDRAKQADAQWLSADDFDLTLFCRDTYSLEYIAVRCNCN